jgi:hypothetical protein
MCFISRHSVNLTNRNIKRKLNKYPGLLIILVLPYYPSATFSTVGPFISADGTTGLMFMFNFERCQVHI